MIFMNRNSTTTRIKVIKKLSEAIITPCDMSPEFFKLCIHELSIGPEAIDGLSMPELYSFKVSHLL
jgi:hypothetical protein